MLEFIDVSVGYGRTVVVHDATMTTAPAGITTLLGHNGASKTTLLRAARGLLRPVSGAIRSTAKTSQPCRPTSAYAGDWVSCRRASCHSPN